MTQNSAVFEQQLSSFGISLHQAIINQLIGEIELAINDGVIRSTGDKHSIYDFIREILGKTGERKAWKRFTEEFPDVTVALSHSVKLARKDGKKANIESPVTDIFGLLYIAYTMDSEFSHNLRVSSARLVFSERQSSPKPINTVEHLERSLEATREALQNYPYTLEKLWKDSGIVNKSQVKGAIIRDFLEGRDYIWADDILCLNESTFMILIVSFKSLKGADISQLPEIIRLNTKEYFQHQLQKKMNRRVGQVDENQLTLFDI
jgi:hypothetical protein